MRSDVRVVGETCFGGACTCFPPFSVCEVIDDSPWIFRWDRVRDGVGWGRMPATMQSSWNTAVISTRRGGRLAEAAVGLVLGLSRMRATLIWSAQAMRRVESSCQNKVHLNRSARGLSAGLSINVMRDWDMVSYILTPCSQSALRTNMRVQDRETHQVICPCNESRPPPHLPYRPFVQVKDGFLVPQPSLLA